MYDIKPLEEEWKKYHAKQRIPYIVFILLLVGISIVIYLFFYNKIDFTNFYTKIKLNNTINIKQDTHKKENKFNNTLLNSGLQQLEKKDISILPNVNKIIKSKDTLVDIPILDFKNEKKKLVDNKVHLNIIQTSSPTAYADVEKRFLQTKDLDDALFLAKSYYKKGNYKKARYWALEINKIDDGVEVGLFIFVKSKFKLGQRNESLLILKNYIKKSNSEAAKNLLNKIENDKL